MFQNIIIIHGLDFSKPIEISVFDMEPQNITMLNNLNPLSNSYTVKLKIVSLWRKMMHDRPTETYRVDMICMDKEVRFIKVTRFRLAVCIGFCQGFRTTSSWMNVF
ncbi:hypothetical protein HanXRQr2_Chr11g0474331 [Helianthus annuus]|uniref:Uncharacterized protein n=2 Tax=Helianthus annuus TaxID=4232 RepID=A0A9K3MYS2_HELAN|nr:hypothetical protein HanXRQr2_Chr11g0474331 [Helianthus annuus]